MVAQDVGRPGVGRFLSRLGSYLRPHAFRSGLCGLTLLVRVAFLLALPLFYREIFDGVLAGGGTRQLTQLLAWMAAAFAVVVAADLAQSYLAADLAGRVTKAIRQRYHARLLRLPDAFYARVQTGDLMSRFTNDLFSVDWAVSVSALQTLFATLMTVASMGLLLYLDWRLALPTIALLPLTFLGPRLLSQHVVQATTGRKRHEAEVARVLQEDLAGHRVIQAYGLESAFEGRFADRLGQLFRSGVQANLMSAFLTKSSDVGVVIMQLTIVSGGAALALQGHVSGGDLVAFLTVLFAAGSSVQLLTQYVPDLLDGAAGLQRIDEILAEPVPDDGDAPESLPPFSRQIDFGSVGFRYNGGERVLSGVDLAIRRGESVALVGRSGSGKSTVLNLLTRFCDASDGSIRIDGRDLSDLPRAAVRARMGAVFQHAHLFDMTVRENIRLGRPAASDDEVESAARAAEIDQAIHELPDGYDTAVGEGGSRLSGGQRQRIALARAILRDPEILVLDEATSALDPSTEAAVNETLERMAADRTLISVTHRLNAVAGMDRIYVLDRGRVVEHGRHKELLNLKGHYYDMWQEHNLELTGNALLGEQTGPGDDRSLRDWAADGSDGDEEGWDRDLDLGPDDLSMLIQKLESEDTAEEEARDLRQVNQQWAQLVGTDRVTGLPNKLAFVEALAPAEIQQARRNGEPVGLVLLAADNLGPINEEYGRNAGDQVIGGLAEFLRSTTLGEETLAHLDGTNFALLLYPADAAVVLERAETLRRQIARHAFQCAGAQVRLTISAGVLSLDPGQSTDPKEATMVAFERLNGALYRAKKSGGDRVEAVTEDDMP